MDASAPLPSLADQKPTWDAASELVRQWGLDATGRPPGGEVAERLNVRSAAPRTSHDVVSGTPIPNPGVAPADASSHIRRMPLPRWVEPQLAKLVEKAPTGPQWVHEIKFDGYRMAARIERGKVQLLTRSGLDWTEKYPRDGCGVRQASGQDGLHRRRTVRRPRRRRDVLRIDAAVL